MTSLTIDHGSIPSLAGKTAVITGQRNHIYFQPVLKMDILRVWKEKSVKRESTDQLTSQAAHLESVLLLPEY